MWVGPRSRIGKKRQRRNAFLQLVVAPDEYAKADRERLASDLARLFGHDLAEQAPVTMSQMRAMRACDLTSRLGELEGIPTLVVSGRHDPIARSGRRRVNGLLADHFAGVG